MSNYDRETDRYLKRCHERDRAKEERAFRRHIEIGIRNCRHGNFWRLSDIAALTDEELRSFGIERRDVLNWQAEQARQRQKSPEPPPHP